MNPQTIDVLPLDRRADLGALDDEQRAVELIFSTGADVVRYDYLNDTRYVERLSMKPEHIRLDRLNASAPLLNSHSADSLADQIGVVEEGSARIVGKKGIARVRFSKRADVEPIFQDVKDRIVRNVSVGYRVYESEEIEGKGDKLPVRLATDWEPYEISMVPMPADIGSQTRSAVKKALPTNSCVVITRAQQETTAMPETQNDTQSEFIVERDPLATDEPRLIDGAARAAAEPNDRDLGANAERERVQGILIAARAARLPQKVADKLIAEGTPLVRAQSLIFEELGKREDPSGGAPREIATRGRVEMGDDPLVHERVGIENALAHRVNPKAFKLEDVGRKYRGLTLLEVAKIHLNSRGHRTTDMSKNEIAGLALGLNMRTGYNTTSDFSTLLANTAGRTLRQEYAAAPQTFSLVARRITLPDYKASVRMQMGEAPSLLRVEEHGEYTHGTIGQGSETMQLAKYGRKFAITREAIVNDDTDSFSRVPAKFGRAARNLESNLVWLQILSNPVMGDGIVLFHASHGNLAATPAVINVTSVGLGRKSMRLQTSLESDGTTYLDVTPRYLLVPPSLETVADQFVTPISGGATEDVNPFGGRLQVISEPRLENGVGTSLGSSTAWYLAASAENGVDLIEYGYLDGEEGPVVESRVGFDIDGLEIKCRLDFAAKVIDPKGFYKNAGV